MLNERVTLWRKDKIPYGTWFSFEQLHRLFPKAEIVTETPNNNKKTIFNKFSPNSVESKIMMNQGKSVRIIISPFMSPTAEQWSDLQQFVSNGNQLLISSLYFSDMLLDSLKLKIGLEGHHETIGEFRDSLTLSIADPATQEEKSFTYPGRGYDQYFSDIDTGYTAVLGWNAKGKPDFVRINYNSGGSIFIHLAPMAFTNFFLLHKDNKEYYDRVMSYFRYKAEVVVWSDSYRDRDNGSRGNSTSRAFGFLMKQPALAWALWLLLILFGLIYFFSSRRKQRIIPVIQPLKNTSLDFVKTIGRLYFQRRDNHNLVQKMTTHFQTHIRNRYNIPSFNMDEEFVKKLAYKSGQSYETLYALVYQAKYLSDKQSVTDTELMNYNALLENFYKSS